jgi:hypothetical protein
MAKSERIRTAGLTKETPGSGRKTPYYSIRTGKNPFPRGYDLDTVRDLFRMLFIHFHNEGYFQEELGIDCVDGYRPGNLGHDLEGALFLELRKRGLTPIHAQIVEYSEDNLFDIIEFLYDHCSKPTSRYYHDYAGCGWHCDEFEREPGRLEYRERVNKVLGLYGNGYELSADGEILALADDGLSGLFEAPLPKVDTDNVAARVTAAQTKFRRYRSSMEDRRDAIRDLADVLEYLRPRLKTVLTKKDEAALFEIANNFGIRHHNSEQSTDYDKPIWYSWIFYFYLATIHAAIRLIEQKNTN